MASQQEPYYTPEEYLASERDAEGKHEYLDGRIYAMTGGTAHHSLITGNVIASLHSALRGRPCRVFTSDLKVRVAATGLHTYPDVSALCAEPRFASAHGEILLNPSVLVEVLSPSTEAYDRGGKFQHYQQLPSLQEYVLIAQDGMQVDCFSRASEDGTRWVLTAADGPEGVVELPSIECVLRLRDVYERVDVPARRPVRAVREPAEPAIFYTDAPEPV